MNLNKENWGSFKISDLFPVLQNGKANQGMLSDGNFVVVIALDSKDFIYSSMYFQSGNPLAV